MLTRVYVLPSMLSIGLDLVFLLAPGPSCDDRARTGAATDAAQIPDRAGGEFRARVRVDRVDLLTML